MLIIIKYYNDKVSTSTYNTKITNIDTSISAINDRNSYAELPNIIYPTDSNAFYIRFPKIDRVFYVRDNGITMYSSTGVIWRK